MKLIFKATILAALVCPELYAQSDSLQFKKISDNIMLQGQCYSNLRVLCKSVGNRLSGTATAEKAVQWGYDALKKAGADTVWLQPVMVPKWHRGQEKLSLQLGEHKWINVPALSLGNTEGTNGKVLEAPIIMVQSFEELNALPDEQVKGKIVFFNYKMKQDFVNTFNAYGDAVKYRWASPNFAAPKGAVGVIIRSMSTGEDDYPHTGSMRYKDSVTKIPEMAIGNRTADKLYQYCLQHQALARIQNDAHLYTTLVPSFNVIGEIKGSKFPDRIITVGGHLDSWDVGEGAHDDGAGCVQSIEILRTFKSLGLKPNYTIRAVLFMNEENGLKGGEAYADSALSKNEHHVLAIETDAGGFAPRGIGLEMGAGKKQQIKKYAPLFLPYGVYDFDQEEGGADISPLQRKMGIPVAGLLPESQRYFDVHHTPNDVFETVNHRELKLGAIALTQFIYLVSTHELF